MGVERVDYSSDDEFQQALQQEEQERMKSEEPDQLQDALDNCIGDLGEIIEKYRYDVVKYCLGNFEPKKENV